MQNLFKRERESFFLGGVYSFAHELFLAFCFTLKEENLHEKKIEIRWKKIEKEEEVNFLAI